MKLFLALLFSIIGLNTFACSCAMPPPFKTKDDLKAYQVISLVKIDKLAPMDTARYRGGLRINGDIKVTVLEQFKGESTTLFTDLNYNSSCAMTFEEGEEWLFFGTAYQDKMTVGMCTYSIRYRRADGMRQWAYFNGIRDLAVLRDLYGHKPYDLKNLVYYANGKKEIQQNFKNGKLNGIRKIWYPNGQPFIVEEFKDGERVGHRLRYSESGQLTKDVLYKNKLILRSADYHDTAWNAGLIIDRIKYADMLKIGNEGKDSADYQRELDSLRKVEGRDKQLSLMTEYSVDGSNYKAKYYNLRGNLQWDRVFDLDKGYEESFEYYDNGKLKIYHKYDNGSNKDIEQDYKENGTHKDYESKCGICDVIFKKDAPLAAKPEAIYIQ